MVNPEQDRLGHPIRVVSINRDDVEAHPTLIEDMMGGETTGVIVRGALSDSECQTAIDALATQSNDTLWESPNTGMHGGEIRTIGAAATPTFTAFRGPSAERYGQSARDFHGWHSSIFKEASPTPTLKSIFSGLFGGRPAEPPQFDEKTHWLPYNLRALDPGVQIYSHHDNHYGLDIYKHLDERFDRGSLMSWFVTLQPAESDGELVIYGLWGSDPNPPMLPSRFVDTAALERDYLKETLSLGRGDLVIFDSGRHVHRVTPVGGERARLTVGGFLTIDTRRTQLAFWS